MGYLFFSLSFAQDTQNTQKIVFEKTEKRICGKMLGNHFNRGTWKEERKEETLH